MQVLLHILCLFLLYFNGNRDFKLEIVTLLSIVLLLNYSFQFQFKFNVNEFFNLTTAGALTLRGLYLRLIPHSAGLFSSQYNNSILTWSNKQTNKQKPSTPQPPILFSINFFLKCSTRFFVWKRLSNLYMCVVWKR